MKLFIFYFKYYFDSVMHINFVTLNSIDFYKFDIKILCLWDGILDILVLSH